MAEVKSGYMHKCGKKVRSWKKRWFVLKPNGFLYYYEGPDKGEKGKIDVVDASSIAPWQEVGTAERKLPPGLTGGNAFAIVCPDRTYTCVCEENEDCRSWMETLEKVRTSGDQQQYPAPTFAKNNQQPSNEDGDNFQAPPIEKPHPIPPSQGLPPPIPPSQGLPPQYTSAQAQNMPSAPPHQPMPAAAMPNPSHYGGSNNIGPPAVNPVGGPGFQGSYPVGHYQGSPAGPPMPMPQPISPNYRPPPPPQQFHQQPPQYYQGPPRAAYGSYPQGPPRAAYGSYPQRPQPKVNYQPRVYYQQRPPQQRPPQQRQTNVTVVTLSQTQTQRIVYR